MNKRILSIAILLLILVITLTGCGNSEGYKQAKENEENKKKDIVEYLNSKYSEDYKISDVVKSESLGSSSSVSFGYVDYTGEINYEMSDGVKVFYGRNGIIYDDIQVLIIENDLERYIEEEFELNNLNVEILKIKGTSSSGANLGFNKYYDGNIKEFISEEKLICNNFELAILTTKDDLENDYDKTVELLKNENFEIENKKVYFIDEQYNEILKDSVSNTKLESGFYTNYKFGSNGLLCVLDGANKYVNANEFFDGIAIVSKNIEVRIGDIIFEETNVSGEDITNMIKQKNQGNINYNILPSYSSKIYKIKLSDELIKKISNENKKISIGFYNGKGESKQKALCFFCEEDGTYGTYNVGDGFYVWYNNVLY